MNNQTGVALQHSIAEIPIPVFLKKIAADHLSGTLHIKGDAFEKSLEFRQGVLVSARSSRIDEKIGVILHLTGKIDEAQYDNISALLQVHGSDREVGEILVQNNFISGEELLTALIYLTRRIALSTFLLDKGTWKFEEKNPTAPSPQYKREIELHLPEIIAEGSRKTRNISYFKDKIYFHSPQTIGIPAELQRLFTPEELDFYKKIESCQGLSNGEIISKLNVLPGFYWEKIVLFTMLDVIDFVEHTMDFNRAEAIKNMLELNEKLRSGSIDEYEILGVKKNASIEEIDAAFRQLSYLHHPDRFGSASASEIKKISRFVLNRVKFAHQILVEYKKKSIKPATPQPPAASPAPAPAAPTVPATPGAAEVAEAAGAAAVEAGEVVVPAAPRAQEKDPRFEADNLFHKAEQAVAQKDYHEAVQILKNVVKLDPSRGKYFYLLGICQTELFYYEGDAEANLRKAVELDPWNADPIYALGLLYRKQNKLKLSERCFQRALEINCSHSDAGKAIAQLRHERGDHKKSSFFSLFKQ